MANQLVKGNNAISIDESGWVLFKRPHGTFYSTTSQQIVNSTAAQPITYEIEVDNEGLGHSTSTNTSRVYVPTAGSYEVIFSGVADISAGAANKVISAWIAINGTNVPDSNTIVRIAAINQETIVAVSWINDLAAGDYVELYTWGDAVTCRWLATASGTNPTRPSCPSVITTVKKISSRLSYA